MTKLEPVAWRYRHSLVDIPLPWLTTTEQWLADRERQKGAEVEALVPYASPPAPAVAVELLRRARKLTKQTFPGGGTITAEIDAFLAGNPIATPKPFGWARGVHQPSTPNGPAEYDVDFVYGDDEPAGDGWFPVYREPAPPPPATRSYEEGVEAAATWVEGRMVDLNGLLEAYPGDPTGQIAREIELLRVHATTIRSLARG